MLQSILDKSIEYIQEKNIEKSDVDLESPVYHMKLFNIELSLTVGNINREYASTGILYCPVYLIISKTKFEKIGYFEFYSSDMGIILDKDGDLDISIMEGPLLYEYVDHDYLQSVIVKSKFLRDFIIEDEEYTEKTKDADEDDVELQAEKIGIEEKKNQIVSNLESIENVDKILSKYEGSYNTSINNKTLTLYKKDVKSTIITENSNWLQEYYRNNKYNILDNEGGGDCFFATIRDALAGFNININVDSLRIILSNLITKEHFDNYSNVYTSLKSEIVGLTEKKNATTANIKTLLKQVALLKKAAEKETKSGSRDLELIRKHLTRIKEVDSQIKLSKKELKQIVIELKNALKNISEFKFMKSINSLEDFKTVVKSRNYWADSFAISLLEYTLNIKTIILSKKSHLKKESDSLVSCSDMVLDEIEKNKNFKPKYFIIVIYDIEAKHYQLLTYKTKKIFSFYEIPYTIRENVVDNCMKKDNGLFNLISMFNNLKNDMNKLPNIIQAISRTNKLLEINKLDEYTKSKSKLEEVFSGMTSKRQTYIPTLLEVSGKKEN